MNSQPLDYESVSVGPVKKRGRGFHGFGQGSRSCASGTHTNAHLTLNNKFKLVLRVGL